MFPWLSHQLISIINNLLLVLKRKQVLIQMLTQGVCIMSKSLILLSCYWKREDGSLLHFLFQTAITVLSYFFWNQYLELEPNKLQKFCGSSSGKCFGEWSVNSRENQVGLCGGLTLVGWKIPTRMLYHSSPHQGEEEKIRWKRIYGKIMAV